MPIERRQARIARERAEMGLRPWERAPSEVDDDSPPVHPIGTAGYTSWLQAQQWRREIREKQPGYFDVENTDEYWGDDCFYDDDEGTDDDNEKR